MISKKTIIDNSKTLVIKLGSSNLVSKGGKLKEDWLHSFVKDIIKKLRKRKNDRRLLWTTDSQQY